MVAHAAKQPALTSAEEDSGYTNGHTNGNSNGINGHAGPNGFSKTKTYTMAEVATHDKENDLWIVLEGKVYNITTWSKKHPGGAKVLMSYAGQDATDAFYGFHAEEVSKRLPPFLIGEVSDYRPADHILEFRELRKTFEKEGQFVSNRFYFLFLIGLIVLTELIGLSMLVFLPDSTLVRVLSGIIVGFAWGQGGWIMHDCGHSSVFRTSSGNLWGQRFVMNFIMGGSALWWNGRHNRHHAAPNRVGHDLDISTLPLFAWDKVMAQLAPKWMIRYQHLYWSFFGPPVLMFLYKVVAFSWMYAKKYWTELSIACIQLTYAIPMLWHMGFFGALGYYAVVLLTTGSYLGWIFALNHYGFPLLRSPEPEKDKHGSEILFDWVKQTAYTTQNVLGFDGKAPSELLNWFTGGLTYQLEHHLFPRMPRHNYPIIHKRVVAFLKKNNLPYFEKRFQDAFVGVFDVLRKSPTMMSAFIQLS